MGEILQLDYYYGIEAEQFSFYRVPRLLIKDERYRGLSSDAKLLYGLMLDRMSLSMKNGWLDDKNRAYIIYTIDNIMDDLGCSKPTCIKIIKELDSDSGIGLIEKVRRGLGKPDIIYVKNFSTIAETQEEKKPENADKSTEVKNLYFKKEKDFTSASKETELQEVKKSDFKKEKNFTSGSKETELQEVKEFAPNYTNYNQTYMNQTNYNHTEESYNNPINQSATEKPQDDVIDSMDDAQAYIELIKENINYDHHMKYDGYGEKELYARYKALDAQYAKEQDALEIEIAELEKAVTGYEQSQKSAEKFIALIDKYENFDTLTNTMLNEFVEKILVHERARKGSQDTTQEIEIYFNFLGRYIPPSLQPVPLTPEEQEELQKKEERKDRLHQNYLKRKASGAQKRYEDKIKAKKKAEMDAKKALIRAEDMKKGVFSTIGQLPKEEPRKGSIAASAAV